MKRFLLILSLSLLCAFESIAQTSGGVEFVDSLHMHFIYRGIRYAFEDGQKSLYVDVNYNEETPTKVDIAGKIKIDGKDYLVKRIGSKAFYGCRNITCVTIPNEVEIIDSSAFRWCVNLSVVRVLDNIKRIGPDCFRNCTNLRNYYLSNGLTTISTGAFRASGLMSIVLPNGLKDIGAYAFEGCKALSTVRFSKTVRTIGKEAFANCWALSMVLLYDQVRNVGEGAFMSCRSLKMVAFSKLVESSVRTVVSADAFTECKSLDTVVCNTSRVGKVKDVVFHENSFRGSPIKYENIIYGGKPVDNPNAGKRKKGEPEFEEDEILMSEDNAERLRTSETVKRGRKDVGVQKNPKKKKR